MAHKQGFSSNSHTHWQTLTYILNNQKSIPSFVASVCEVCWYLVWWKPSAIDFSLRIMAPLFSWIFNSRWIWVPSSWQWFWLMCLWWILTAASSCRLVCFLYFLLLQLSGLMLLFFPHKLSWWCSLTRSKYTHYKNQTITHHLIFTDFREMYEHIGNVGREHSFSYKGNSSHYISHLIFPSLCLIHCIQLNGTLRFFHLINVTFVSILLTSY